MQNTSTIMMIRPKSFGFNEETAENNSYQQNDDSFGPADIRKLAIIEFNNFVEALRTQGIDVIVYEDTETPEKPDAIFPNNWITTHIDNSVITYPMYAVNRRSERREDIVEDLMKVYPVEKRYSFEQYEDEDIFLEGTGSMILDRVNKIVYACLSPRTDITLLNKFAILKHYKVVAFNALDKQGEPIYHTNVMMSVGRDIAVICLDSINNETERKQVIAALKESGKEIIEISQDQVNSFAGNMLEIENKEGEAIMVMSDTAYRSLTQEQLKRIRSFSKIINVDIKTIEKYGGGSARCMMAEIFLEKENE